MIVEGAATYCLFCKDVQSPILNEIDNRRTEYDFAAKITYCLTEYNSFDPRMFVGQKSHWNNVGNPWAPHILTLLL